MNGVPPIVEILESLRRASPQVSGACVTSLEGRLLGSAALEGIQAVQVSGLSAASLAIARKGTKDLKLGGLEGAQIVGTSGAILLLDVGTKAVLTVIVRETARLESVAQEARKAAQRLAEIV
jgi:predicted regulator of Ras-like GTPase activity (Roadblock/LC7/MglB family)